MKAMILAAGLGTRLKPFTDEHPKALMPVNSKSLLQRNIEYLASFNIHEIIINVHHFASQILDEIKKNNGFGSAITFSDESNEVLETGGGLLKAEWFFNDEPFLLMNADILTDLDINKMAEQHKNTSPLATLAVRERETSRYFLFDETGRLCGWKNEKTGEQKMSREITEFNKKAFSGIHILSPEIFPLLKKNYEGKFSITDAYIELAKTMVIRAFEHTDSKFIDVGKPESVLQAERIFV